MRKPIIAGNWKMNKDIEESISLVKDLTEKVKNIKDVEIVVCPPFTSLSSVKTVLDGTNVKLGAQNMWEQDSGAYTGEISGLMLKSAGCEYVIIAHSERRQYFKESNELINNKIKKALTLGLKPIVCVGETLEEREKQITENVIKDQIIGAFENIPKESFENIVVAYEPVWAIGTGKTATPEQAEEVHVFIRNLFEKLYDTKLAESLRIQYGGSVKPSNIKDLMSKENIDGALVGGASLDADSFTQLVSY